MLLSYLREAVHYPALATTEGRCVYMGTVTHVCYLFSQDIDLYYSNVVMVMMKIIMDPDSSVADLGCMILSNLTRPSRNIERVIELIKKCGFTLDQIVSVFTNQQYNKKGASLHYLGPVFSNLSQSVTFRR
jgi:Na+-transporting methylmalonyl-CoA/oxaloacetate decarboxylase beta subunit